MVPIIATSAVALSLSVVPPAHASAAAWHRLQVRHAVTRTHLAQDAMGMRRTPFLGRLGRYGDPYIVWLRDHRWRPRARRAEATLARWRLLHPYSSAWLAAALCVHGKEGSWTANTGNGYFGGMQFDMASWYGWPVYGERFASRPDLATPAEQLLASYRYWKVSGWHPWPNTAHACGLI
jgi:hypothetical protein